MKPYQKRNLSKSYFILIFVVYITTLIVINEGHVNRINNYVKMKGLQFHQSIADITNSYENFSDFIFHSDINVNKVLGLMDQASKASESERVIIREELYSELFRVYTTAQNYDFNQLHFHLPSGESFLRFHKVSEFGDSLIGIRPSIKKIIEQKRINRGFEGGRFLSGYRFLYPLINNGQYVGSVELVISAKTIIKELYKSMDGLDVALIIKEDIIEVLREDDIDEIHEYSLLSDEYLIEKENLNAVQNNGKSLKLIKDESFNEVLKNKIKDHFITEQSFNISLKFERKDYVVHFHSIKDFESNHVGYLYLISETNSIVSFGSERNQLVLIASAIMMLMISLFYLILKKEEEISKYAMIDSLTGIYNRGTFIDFAQRFFARQTRDNLPISVAMIDVDYFKEVNDIHGHRVGDKILVEIVREISDSIRDSDILARYGGDEFVMLLPDTNIDVASIVLERVRSHIEHTPFLKVNSITISVGVHERLENETLEEVIQMADDALYEAKQNGRNIVIESKPSK
ncbi:MAG: diguanylate cyclase [Erysipelothrix sp.]|nr:diguanylate cyclase [Erysipelothrix sp.]